MFANKIKNIMIAFSIPAILFAVFTALTPAFGFKSLPVIFSQSIVPTIIGFGMAFSMIAGLFELSAGVQIVTSGVTGALLSSVMGPWGLVVGCVLTGVLMGTLMGGVYTLVRIPSLVVSLGMVLATEVIGLYLTNRAGYISIKNDISFIGSTPYNYIIAAIAAVFFYLIFNYTKFSYNVKVVGDNELVAKTMGVNVKSTKFLAYILGGVFFGIAAILEVCYANTISVATRMSTVALIFKPMMGLMIGLQLMPLINNLIVNILIGQISLAIIFNGLIAMGVRSTFQDVLLGFFMLVVMMVSMNKGILKEWNRKRKAKNA